MFNKRFFLLLIVCCYFGSVFSELSFPSKELRKQLQGPPSEFSDFLTPTPEQSAQRVSSALIPVNLQKNSAIFSYSLTYNVDNAEEFSMAILSPHVDNLKIYVQPPVSSDYTLLVDDLFKGDGALGVKSSGPFGIDGANAPSLTYTFFDPAVGEWKIKIESDTELPKKTVESSVFKRQFSDPDSQPEAYLLLDNESPMKLFSHLTDYLLDEGLQIGVAVKMYDELEQPASTVSIPTAKIGVIEEAVMDVFTPSGKQIEVDMHDDGLHNDGLANDGTYAGIMYASDSGDYVARAIIKGKNTDGTPFIRTSQHLIGVSSSQLKLTDQAFAKYNTVDKTVTFLVDVTDTPDQSIVRAYSEVWGQSRTDAKTSVPIAWASAMVDSVDVDGHKSVVELQVHESWMDLASAGPPFVLKNVILQDRDSFAILSQKDEIAVTGGEELKLFSELTNNRVNVSVIITEEMRYGRRPQSLRMSHLNSTQAGKILLVHGYCSSSVWPPSEFTDAIVFEDYGQSRSNDQFARLIMEAGKEYPSYSIVAHSQGGLASLHLKTYYWSGLDNAQKGRLIQSVGSPYRGCSLSGVLADIGWLFGFGCGSNFDLSVDGASLWYSKLPKYVGGPQDAVYYYTTRYTNNWWFFSNCVTAVNLILSKPNDGTCELKYASLDNGHGMGTLEGWCHIGNMKYPPQCADAARNKEMNTWAAR